MTAIGMLKEDHKRVLALFRNFETASLASQQQGIGERVFEELDVHTSLEEEIFYPAVKTADEPYCESLVREAIEEHEAVQNLIKELQGLTAESQEYQAKFAVLIENVKRHIENEEAQMLPLAESTFDRRQLSDLGQQLKARKRKLTSPGLIGETLGQAKNLIAEAVSALTGSPASKSHARHTRRSVTPAKKTQQRPKRRPRKAAAAAKATRHSKRARPRPA